MSENYNSKEFNKAAKDNLTLLIVNYLNEIDNADNADNADSSIVNIEKFFKYLMENDNISDINKINFFYHFEETIQFYIKNWLIKFLVNSILKIYKNKINNDLLINSEYLIFRFLAYKEFLKNLIIKNNELALLSYLVNEENLFIEKVKKNKSSYSLYEQIIPIINNNINNIKEFFPNINEIDIIEIIDYKIDRKYKIIPFYCDLKIKLITEYDSLVNFNNKYIFEIKNKNEIIFTDFFKKYIKFMFPFLDINSEEVINLDINDFNSLKNQFEQIIIFCKDV